MAKEWASEVMSNSKVTGELRSKPQLRVDLLGTIQAALRNIDPKARKLRTREWSHLSIEESDWRSVLEQADALHAKDDLFGADLPDPALLEPLLEVTGCEEDVPEGEEGGC